jgi:RNA polymerase sigma-32 factor
MDILSTGEESKEKIAQMDESERMSRWLNNFKRRLNERDRFVLENHIMSEEPMTLRDIGDRYKVSRESIRQRETRVSRKLLGRLHERAAGRSAAQMN